MQIRFGIGIRFPHQNERNIFNNEIPVKKGLNAATAKGASRCKRRWAEKVHREKSLFT